MSWQDLLDSRQTSIPLSANYNVFHVCNGLIESLIICYCTIMLLLKKFFVWRTFINRYTILLLEPIHVECSENMVNQLARTYILPYTTELVWILDFKQILLLLYFIIRWSTIMKADIHNFSIQKYIYAIYRYCT